MQEKEKGQQKLQQKQQYTSILPFYEKLERYNIDNSNKKRVFIFWFIFGLLLIAVFITSHYTPEAFIVKTNGSQLSNTHHQNCQNPVSFQNNTLYCEQFSQKNPKIGLLLKNLTPLNQFAQINVVFLPNKGKPSFIKIDQVFRIELMSLKRKKIQIDENRAVIGFEKGQDVKILQNLQFNSQNLQLTNILMEDQRIQIGYQINLGYYRQFKTNDALFIINFLNFDPTLTQFYDVVANAILINPQYTKFMIIIRAIFVCIMIVSSIAFHYFLKQKNFFKMPKEQRVVFILSILIILFNDPYYFIGVFKPNVISVLIESLFITGFIIGLLFSWIYMLRTINYQTRQQDYSLTYKERVIYIFVSLGYFIIIFLFNYQVNRYSYSQNPIVAFHKIFKLMIIITSVIFSIILLYIIYQYGRIIAVWQNLIWRNKIYILFNVFFIFLLFLFILAGWFSFYDQSSQKFQILYASMNIYILYLQYSFTIPRDKIQSGLNDGSIFQEIHSSATIKIRYNHFQKDGGVLVDLSKSQIENKVNIPADSLQQQIIDEYQ